MRRFRLSFIGLSLLLLGPVAFLVHRAVRSVALERQLRHQVVAERVFDEMERSLSRLLEVEEEQAFDDYGNSPATATFPFVIGHFQIAPDSSVRSLKPALESAPARAQLETLVSTSWRAARSSGAGRENAPSQSPGSTVSIDAAAPAAAAPEARRSAAAAKTEVSAFDALRSLNKGVSERVERQRKTSQLVGDSFDQPGPAHLSDDSMAAPSQAPAADANHNEVERAPMIGHVIDARHLLLYQTVVRDRQAYRQGLVVDLDRLGVWLGAQALGSDGLAQYAQVSFATSLEAAPATPANLNGFAYKHRFAEPFDDLTARLTLQALPGVGSVTYVYTLSAVLLVVGLLGLVALYRMVAVVVAFSERRSNFVAAVSHELKTPLTAIRMYAEMLREGMVSSEAKRDEYYRQITTESERLSRLINNVLEFSRLEKGTREMALVVGRVEPVLRDVVALLRPHVEAEGFTLRLQVDGELPSVRFEPDALVQVLCNLVDNAVKYARTAATREIVLRCWNDGGAVYVSVRDHGPGVAARHLGKIFEPFYRGESELVRRSKGTGIGLALVRGLVERMGARVSGHNATGGGFEVEIAFRPAVPC